MAGKQLPLRLALLCVLASCAPGASLARGTVTPEECVRNGDGAIVQTFTLSQPEARALKVTLLVTSEDSSVDVGQATGEFQAEKDKPQEHSLRVDGSTLGENEPFECTLRIG